MSKNPRLGLLLSTAILVASGTDAHGNGRFPSARFLVFGHGDAASIIALETTFGLVTSADGGRTWQYSCEEALGLDSAREWDPAIAINPTGSILVGLPDGISLVPPSYCGFSHSASAPPDSIADFTIDSRGTHVAAAVATLSGGHGIVLSDDGGATWRRGWFQPGFEVVTVDIAPGQPDILYLSGWLATKPALLRSDDGGMNFTQVDARFPDSVYLYIAGVDPENPDLVYVRSDIKGTGTSLLRSNDGGRTFRELTQTANPMTGVAFAPGGRMLWVGSPGINPGDGIFRSTDAGDTWQRVAGGYTTLCLRYREGVLYMCADGVVDPFALGCSIDGGETFEPLLLWEDLVGPGHCPVGTVGRDQCESRWNTIRPMVVSGKMRTASSERCYVGASKMDAGVPDAAATEVPDGAPEAGPRDGVTDRGAGGESDGCSCRLSGRRRPSGRSGLGLLMLVGVALWWRRRPSWTLCRTVASVAFVLVSSAALLPSTALANGAFPDSLKILLPPDRPQTIILATNFGLVSSSDGGRTWQWSCEHEASMDASLYQLSPPPGRTIFSAKLQIGRTGVDGCVWRSAAGRLARGTVTDVFVDSTDGNRVLAVVNPNDANPPRVHVFESRDGGESFRTDLFAADPYMEIGGVESARTDPSIVYLTWASLVDNGRRSGVIRLEAGGVQKFDLNETLNGQILRIVAVDPKNARKVFLRAWGPGIDQLAISEDGGATARVALEVNGLLSGFVQREDGTLFVASRDATGSGLFISRDGGKTFSPLPSGPRFRALADRGGRLFAAGFEGIDGFALGTSDDDGQTWQRLMVFGDVGGTTACSGVDLRQVCAPVCGQLVGMSILRPAVCGVQTADASANAGDRAIDGGAFPSQSSGCECRVSSRRQSTWPSLVALGVLGWWERCLRRGLARTGTSLPRPVRLPSPEK